MFRRLVREEEGQTATEYMLILSVVVIAVAVAGWKYSSVFGDGVEKLGVRVMLLMMFGAE